MTNCLKDESIPCRWNPTTERENKCCDHHRVPALIVMYTGAKSWYAESRLIRSRFEPIKHRLDGPADIRYGTNGWFVWSVNGEVING